MEKEEKYVKKRKITKDKKIKEKYERGKFVQQIKEKVCDGRKKWMGETKLLLDGKKVQKK